MKKTLLSLSIITASFNVLANESVYDKALKSQSSIATNQANGIRDITVTPEAIEQALKDLKGDSFTSIADYMVTTGTIVNSKEHINRTSKKVTSSKRLQNSSYQQSNANVKQQFTYDYNDPFYNFQRFYFDADPELEGASSGKNVPDFADIYGIITSTLPNKVRVGVIDAFFVNSGDLTAVEGHNFHGDGITINTDNPDYEDKDFLGCDSAYHGLGVASVIGAVADNSIGMAGASSIDLVYAKAMGCEGYGLLTATANSIYWLAGGIPNVDFETQSAPQIEPVKIINISSAIPSEGQCLPEFEVALQYAFSKDITVVVSAGNYNDDASDYSPANCEGVIVVGGLDEFGNKAEFSNYGPTVDVSTVSFGIIGYDDLYTEDNLDEDINSFFSMWDGTSFAAPLVTATIAVMLSADPLLTDQDILEILIASSDPYPDTSNTNSSEMGFSLNASTAIRAAYYNSAAIVDIDYVATASSLIGAIQTQADEFYTQNNSRIAEMCASTLLDISSFTVFLAQSGNPILSVYKVAKGQAFYIDNAEIVGEINALTNIVRGYNFETEDFYIQTSLNGVENNESFTKIEFDEESNPVFCQK